MSLLGSNLLFWVEICPKESRLRPKSLSPTSTTSRVSHFFISCVLRPSSQTMTMHSPLLPPPKPTPPSSFNRRIFLPTSSPQQLKSTKRIPAMDACFNAIKFLILKFIFLNLIPKFKSAQKVYIALARPLLMLPPPNQSTDSSGPPHW